MAAARSGKAFHLMDEALQGNAVNANAQDSCSTDARQVFVHYFHLAQLREPW
jgi:hypothetical protein